MLKRHKDISKLDNIIEKLANEKPLLPKHKDHDLVGRFTSFRECHIEPDWLLIYKVDGVFLYLTLFRTGTHRDLSRDNIKSRTTSSNILSSRTYSLKIP